MGVEARHIADDFFFGGGTASFHAMRHQSGAVVLVPVMAICREHSRATLASKRARLVLHTPCSQFGASLLKVTNAVRLYVTQEVHPESEKRHSKMLPLPSPN